MDAQINVKIECRCGWSAEFKNLSGIAAVQAWFEDHMVEVHPVDDADPVKVYIAR